VKHLLYPALRNGRRTYWCRRCVMPYEPGTYSEHRHKRHPVLPPRSPYVSPFVDRDRRIAIAVNAGLLTLDEIARSLGLTRERIRQIAKRQGISRNHMWVPARPRLGNRQRCPDCHELIPVGTAKQHRLAVGHRLNPQQAVFDVDLLRRLHGRGVGAMRAADALAISTQTAWRWARRLGLPKRGIGKHLGSAAIDAIIAEEMAR
jgi:hypothetical protein